MISVASSFTQRLQCLRRCCIVMQEKNQPFFFFFWGGGVCQGCSAVRNRVILTTAKGHIIDGFKKKIKNNKKEIDNNK